MCGAFKLVVFGCLLLGWHMLKVKAGPVHPAQNNTETHTSHLDPLSSLGHIALKMVEHLAKAEDEDVDIAQLSQFVTSLSEATAIVKHPEIPQLESVQEHVDVIKTKLTDDTAELKETIRQLEESLQATQNLVVTLQTEHNKTKVQFQQFKEKTEARHSQVAFTASATTHESLSSSTVVRFDKVSNNYGNHYDPTIGVFTCPVKGLYLVSLKVEEYGSKGLDLEVVVAGMRIFFLYADGSGSHESPSGSAVAECQQGQRIWVQSVDSGQIYAHSNVNVFSVCLLYNLET